MSIENPVNAGWERAEGIAVMNKLAVAICGLLTTVLAAGCGAQVYQPNGGGKDQGAALRIAVVPKAIGFSFWEQVRLGAKCAASKHDKVTMQWDGVTSESDVSGQQSLLQNLLAQSPDGLVYAATDAKALANVTRTALQNGTTVANIDSGTKPQPEQVPVFATDNVAAARRGTEFLAKQLGGTGEIALIEFQPGASTNTTRVKGFQQGLAQYPGLKLVARQSSDSSYNRALQVTQDILTAHPGLDGIYAANEPSALGAAEAVRQAGKSGEIKIVGWDTSQGEIQAVRDGVITGLIAQNPFKMGFASVTATIEKLRGNPEQFHDTDTGSMLITKKNVDSAKVRKLLNPSCANPPE